MVSFISKKIEEKENNLGDKLRKAREERLMTVDEASARIGISAKYLVAFEESDFGKLPEGIYADKFLRRYAQYLGINDEALLLFSVEKQEKPQKLHQLKFEQESKWKKFKNFLLKPAIIKNFIIGVIAVSAVVYLYSIAYNIIKPPELNIIAPNGDLVMNEFSIEVKGETEKDVKIFINEKEVFCNNQGYFEEAIDLKRGLNAVKISAKKKYSKENVIYRNILVNDSEVSMK